MASLLNKAAQSLIGIYQKAEDFIEEEMELPLPAHMLNNTIKRFVTDNVSQLQDLHVELFDGWLRLFATVEYKGIRTTLTTDLLLIQFQLDKDTQRLVFEQKSDTRILHATFKSSRDHAVFKILFWVFKHILHSDPLGAVLTRLNIITIEHDLLFLDVSKYLKEQYRVLNALKKIQINHAVIREDTFVLKANLNLRGLFGMYDDNDSLPDDDMHTVDADY